MAITKCVYCGETYCSCCSQAHKENLFCSPECQAQAEQDARETAENERLEGISFDKQRL